MLKILGIVLILSNYFPSIYCQNVASLIQNIVNQTNLDSLTNTVAILSGEKEWTINDTSITIHSRHADQIDNNVAADYLKNKLESWDLDVYEQQYSVMGRNIYAVQQGNLYPGKYYIICAHYDDMPSGTPSPGADDNASGVANVLEAARILRNFNPAYSIIYALWDEEELGYYGSLYFAEQASLSKMDILGVINVDMIGFSAFSDTDFYIHVLSGFVSKIPSAIILVNSFFNINMSPHVNPRGFTGSDHYSFCKFGYDAIFIMEPWDINGANFHWHTRHDRLVFFNLPYFHNLSKISIGTLAYLAFGETISSVNSNNKVNEFSLLQNFPNPFNPTTTIKYQIPELSFATLSIYDVLGNEIVTLVNEEKPAGTYEINWNAIHLPSGIYFCVFKAKNFVRTRKMVLLK